VPCRAFARVRRTLMDAMDTTEKNRIVEHCLRYIEAQALPAPLPTSRAEYEEWRQKEMLPRINDDDAEEAWFDLYRLVDEDPAAAWEHFCAVAARCRTEREAGTFAVGPFENFVRKYGQECSRHIAGKRSTAKVSGWPTSRYELLNGGSDGSDSMRIWIALILLTLSARCHGEPPVLDEARVIDYAKAIDVIRLDSSLPSRSLDEWLRLGPPRLEALQWSNDNCELKPDYPAPPEGFPLCARIAFRRGQVGGWMLVRVGTTRDGIVEPPRFLRGTVAVKSSNGIEYDKTEKLSDLPALIEKRLAQKP
jgi:hypothetical protein